MRYINLHCKTYLLTNLLTDLQQSGETDNRKNVNPYSPYYCENKHVEDWCAGGNIDHCAGRRRHNCTRIAAFIINFAY